MKNTPDKTLADILRQKAMEILSNKPTKSKDFIDVDALKLVHELEVSQVELEMQNEELTKANLAVQNAIDLYDFAPIGCFTLTKDGEIIEVNLKGASLLERERSILKECMFVTFVKDESKPIFDSFIQKVHNNNTKETCEIKLLTSSNVQVYLYLTGNISKNREQCLVTAMDITGLKQNEAIIQQERELYLDIVNNQAAGIYRIRVFQPEKWWDKDRNSPESPSYQMELVSDRFCEILGITRQTFETNPAMIVDLIHPEDKTEFVIKNEEANNRMIPFTWVGRLVIKEKTIWIHLESIPRSLGNGEVLWTGIVLDITVHKRNEYALKESENKYRELVDDSPDAISIYSEGKIVFVNNGCLRLMAALDKEELLGRSVIEFIHPEYRFFAMERMSKIANDRSVQPLTEEKFIRLDGTPVDVEVKSMPITFHNKPAVQLVIRDITERKKIERSLIESEDRFQQLFNKAPLGYQSLDSKGCFIEVNQQWLDTLGFTREEVIGKSFVDFLSSEFKESFRKQYPIFKAQGYIHSEFIMMHKSGKKLFIGFDGTTGFDLNGQFKQTHCILQDITQQRIAENELKKSQEEFKDLFDNAPVGYHEIDDQGRIVRMNQTELDMLGYTLEELIGKYSWEISSNEKHSIELTKDKLHGRRLSSQTYERILLRKDGTKISVLKQDRILRASDGIITGIRTSVHDITERKMADESLKLSAEKFRNIFENSVVGKSMTSIEGAMNVNKAFSQIVGYSKDELSCLNWEELTHKDDVEFDKQVIKSILNGEKSFSQWEKRYIHKNGNIVWVNISVFLQRDNDGNPIYFITEIIDISNRKKSETDLRNSEEKFKKAFMTSPDSIHINRMDDGMYTLINKGFTRFMGYNESDILGKTSKETTIWSDPAVRKNLAIEMKEKGIVENLVAQFRKKSGELIFGMMSASIIELDGVNHILSITRDITEINKAQIALQQSEERFKILFENAPDTMFLANPESGEIIDANEAACKLFKKEKHEFIGINQLELHPKRLNDISKKTYNDHISQCETLGITTPVENMILRSDGTEIPVEILSHTIEIDDKALLVGTFRDITERKKAEQALRDSEELYRNLVLAIPDGVYKSTPEGKFIEVNPAMVKMFGYENKEELMKIDIKKQLYFDSSDRDNFKLNDVYQDTGVFQLKKKDGSAIWVEDHGWYNMDNDRKIVTHEGVLRDVTERKLAEDALRESELILKRTLIESTGLIDKTTESINYEKISDTILEISGAKYVSFNINEEDGLENTTVSISGIKENILKASSYFGFDVINKRWKIDLLREEKTKDKPITRFESFRNLSSGSIPKTVSALIENIFNLGEAFVVKITKNNIRLGDFTLIYPKGETIRNNELVLLFANQVGLFIERENVNKALSENEEKYRYLFENNPQPMYIYDVETLAFLEVNQTAIDQYGYSKEEFLRMTLKDIRPPEDIPALLIDVLENSTDIKPAGVWRHTKKNGEIIFVDITTVSIVSNGRNVRHVLIQDITERRQAEQALRESEDKYRTMIENSNDLIWTLDMAGNFTYVNDIALKISGLGLEDWKGKSLVSLIDYHDLPVLNDVSQRCLNGETCNYKIRLKVTDENIITLLVNTSPIFISDKIEGVLSFGRDITENNRSLKLLKQSEEKFRSIAEQTHDLISITDVNGILSYVSPASKSIFLYEPEEMCGHNYTEFMENEFISLSKTAFRNSIVNKESVNNLELKMKRKDGTTFYGELNGSSFKYGDNYGSLVIIRDMTTQKNAQEELEDKMNELVRFQSLTVGRELAMIGLKKEVNKLLKNSGEEEKYKIVK